MNEMLKTIKATKLEELKQVQARGRAYYEEQPGFSTPRKSAVQAYGQEKGNGIIAEFKRRSPSKGWINQNADVSAVTSGYAAHGASCISVLTDQQYFGGFLEDLQIASALPVPVLRKDFMLDEWQILEARAFGADMILLIAAFLDPSQLSDLADAAHEQDLEVLLELHDRLELSYPLEKADLIGVNSRDLNTFKTDLDIARSMVADLPANKPLIAESGIHDVQTIVSLKSSGYRGFLIGEQFMKHPDPAIAFAGFSKQLKAQYES